MRKKASFHQYLRSKINEISHLTLQAFASLRLHIADLRADLDEYEIQEAKFEYARFIELLSRYRDNVKNWQEHKLKQLQSNREAHSRSRADENFNQRRLRLEHDRLAHEQKLVTETEVKRQLRLNRMRISREHRSANINHIS